MYLKTALALAASLACVVTGTATAWAAPLVETYPLNASSIAYNPVTDRVYASIPSTVTSYGNSVAIINPNNGNVDAYVYVGSGPDQVAVTSDGQYVYVALQGAASIARINTSSNAVDLTFSVGGNYRVDGLGTYTGSDNVVATITNPAFSPDFVGTFEYANGVALSQSANGINEQAIDGTTLYGYCNSISNYELQSDSLSASGITGIQSVNNLVNGGGAIAAEGGLVFFTNGNVVDGTSFEVIGTFSGASGQVLPDLGNNVVYFGESDGTNIYLLEYDPSTFLNTTELTFPDPGGVISLVKWGSNGLAFNTTSNTLYLVGDPVPTVNSVVVKKKDADTKTVAQVSLVVPAPSTGATVTLASSNPSLASVPSAASVPAGSISVDVPISTKPVTAKTTTTISATAGGVTHSTVLTLMPATLRSVKANPASVTGGTSSQGTVTLTAEAPTGGEVITLYTNNPAAVPPGTVTVRANRLKAVFTITTSAVTSPTTVSILANLGTKFAKTQVVVNP